MRISNYSEVRAALHARESFTHGSCSAAVRPVHVTSGGIRVPARYRVWSYNTLILECEDEYVVYFDNRYYSQTTSRLQSMIRAAFPNALPEGETRRLVYEY